jgi:hypothetical protein
MYTMYTRVFGFGFSVSVLFLVAAGCGGGDDDGASSAPLMACDPAVTPMSTPGSPGDPCPQNDPMCPSMPGAYTGPQAACSGHGCVALSNCLPNHTWNTMCTCQPNGGSSVPPAGGTGGTGGGGGGAAGMPAQMGPRCGDGVVQSGEACESGVAITANCASLNMGTGTLACDATTCMYDTSMCSGEMPPMAGMGGS